MAGLFGIKQFQRPASMHSSDPLAHLSAKIVSDINEVAPDAWDRCAGRANPFVRHGFLRALETSESVCADTGWAPQHVIIEQQGRVLACAPLYLKSHSYGEYVFDWNWAEAYERAGGRYYPKLQCCVPFTPVTGPRLLVDPAYDVAHLRKILIRAMMSLAQDHNCSSLHITFPGQGECEEMTRLGMLQRIGTQFHWQNHGYTDFDQFLAALSSRKRKAIRKERRQIRDSGVEMRALNGDTIKPHHWDAFYRFYRNTTDRKWGPAHLNRDFFGHLQETMADHVVLIIGEQEGEMVCGAWNLTGSDTLFGRNWGCLERVKFLHFEACYYQAIDYAIAHRLSRVEAGAQGEHKIQRGYLPAPTYSAHWIRSQALSEAVERFLERERAAVREDQTLLNGMSPFKKEA